jgi:outer membrane receptor protein involved in Fe transport
VAICGCWATTASLRWNAAGRSTCNGAATWCAPPTPIPANRCRAFRRLRVGAALAYGDGPWTARFGFDRYSAQHRVPADGARETAGYTLWNAALAYRMKVTGATLTWYARLDNITNQLAYSATSILTTTVYPAAPLPGRSLKVGLRVTF